MNTEKSFIIKPSTVTGAGVGVFTLHDIPKDTYLALILPDFEEEILDPSEVPEELQMYCLDKEDGKLQCPKHFNRMDIGNYLNHADASNVRWIEDKKGYYALRDIQKGEELFTDYRDLGEPQATQDSYNLYTN